MVIRQPRAMTRRLLGLSRTVGSTQLRTVAQDRRTEWLNSMGLDMLVPVPAIVARIVGECIQNRIVRKYS